MPETECTQCSGPLPEKPLWLDDRLFCSDRCCIDYIRKRDDDADAEVHA